MIRDAASGIGASQQMVSARATICSGCSSRGTSALSGYKSRIVEYGEKLKTCIAEHEGRPIDVKQWFYWFSFDIMGEFAFSRSFDMLDNAQWHHAINLLRGGMSLLGYLTPVPWLGQLLLSITVLPPVRDWNLMIAWCSRRMNERLKVR